MFFKELKKSIVIVEMRIVEKYVNLRDIKKFKDWLKILSLIWLFK